MMTQITSIAFVGKIWDLIIYTIYIPYSYSNMYFSFLLLDMETLDSNVGELFQLEMHLGESPLQTIDRR